MAAQGSREMWVDTWSHQCIGRIPPYLWQWSTSQNLSAPPSPPTSRRMVSRGEGGGPLARHCWSQLSHLLAQ